MAVKKILSGCLRSRKGSPAVEFIMTAAMLILTFAMLISAMIYVTEYYTASYITRRVVRTIEVTGKYDEQQIDSLVSDLGGDSLENLSLQVDANYLSNKRIQLRDEFRVTLKGEYPIKILKFGDSPITLDLPVQIRLSGRSEVYWK